jgi:hypothetical protein
MRELIFAIVTVAACGGNAIDSNEAARRAYLGLDPSIGKSLTLGFDGFNAATSANISPQMTTGTAAGTLTITGQVDQGSSDNKGMRLDVAMVGYTDGDIAIDDNGDVIRVTYNTDAGTPPFLMLTLRNIPSGTLTGSLAGTYHMTGDLEGDATLNLTFAGDTMDGGVGDVVRVPGSTMVTGTATNAEGGMFDVAVTL